MKCPNCNSEKVQLSQVTSSNGCLWIILFGWFYISWLLIKWMIGFTILVCWDWWIAIIKHHMNKGYVWKSRRWFGREKMYYCHDCGHNFKG